MNESSYTQIRNFLIVILGGTAAGFSVVLTLLYSYGPSDTFYAKNVLLSPDVLEKLWYTTSTASTSGERSRFSFQEIELLYFDQKNARYVSQEVPLQKYGDFYRLVDGDVGSSDNAKLEQEFDETPTATILIKSSTNGTGTVTNVTDHFQQIQFSSSGNAYRVELKEDNRDNRWAYFTHDNVYTQAMKILKR